MPELDVELHPDVPSEALQGLDVEMRKNAKKYDVPFFFEPRKHYNLDAIKAACDPILAKGVEHVVVIGTGGSIQTMLALSPFCEKPFHPITSSRPSELKRLLKVPGIRDKAVIVPISRAGETLDINSVLGLFTRYTMLGISSRGTMNGILKTLGAPVMDVPDLSGRFAGSCTNVGLVPAYLAGINVDVLVSGLEDGYRLYNPAVPAQANLAKKVAMYLAKVFKNGFRNVFNMPYSSWLEGSVGLWVQELSESTGKEGKGLLGTSQDAPVCQHSVLELLLGGPKFHSLPFLWVIEKDPHDMPLNSSIPHVQDKTAAETILYQAHATFEALLTKGLPAAMLSLELPTLRNVGHLIAFIQSTVYHLCMILDVNWSNNPNVNIGKQICNEAMAGKKTWPEMRKTRTAIAAEAFDKFWVL